MGSRLAKKFNWPNDNLYQPYKQIHFDYFFTQPHLELENVQSAKYLGITISGNIDLGQHISGSSSKATKILGFLCRNLAFAPKSTKKAAYNTLVRSKLECNTPPIWSPYLNFRSPKIRKFRWQQPTGPAGDGETQVVSETFLISLNDRLLRPEGFSFIRFSVVQCLLKKTILSPCSLGYHSVPNIVDTWYQR